MPLHNKAAGEGREQEPKVKSNLGMWEEFCALEVYFIFYLFCFVALQILSLKIATGGTVCSWQQGRRLWGWIPTKCPRSAQTQSPCPQIDIRTILCTMKEAAPSTTMPNLVFIHPILIKASKRFLALLKLKKMWIDAQTLSCWQCTSLTHVPCAAETLIVVFHRGLQSIRQHLLVRFDVSADPRLSRP